jgi:hypothetical protein
LAGRKQIKARAIRRMGELMAEIEHGKTRPAIALGEGSIPSRGCELR